MNILKLLPVISIATLILSCTNEATKETADLREQAKQEIAKAEKDFEKMAAEKGVPEAFAFYADENATIRRENDTLVTGRENIRKYYEQPSRKNAKVSWTADHIDASGSGDMGYTYGKYSWQSTDSTGKTNEFKGIFSTVWKKQGDGSWKYVWD